MSRRPLIIENPDLQTLRQRYAFAALTFLFWVFWFYLWTPVISLLAWLFGAERFYQAMIARSGFDTLLELIGLYALVILMIGVVLGGWAQYNRLRVRGRDKRQNSATVDTAELETFFMVRPEQLDVARRGKHVVIGHDEHGKIQDVHESPCPPQAT